MVIKGKKLFRVMRQIRFLNENYSEIKNILQNSFDDAVLIGCDEKDFKKKIKDLIENLNFSLGKK